MRRLLEQLSVALAIAGGAMLVALALLTTVSTVGRWLFSQPVVGDVELVQMGCAMMIALSLPYCQLRGAHITVDFFTSRASRRARRLLDAVGALALGAICVVLGWRAGVGVIEMRQVGETTMVLGFPFWMTYLGMVPGMTLSGIVGLHAAYVHLRDAFRRSDA
jgi:TRAP-type C4-dicarboxylate transport system permease small subunit